jgi:hypothetical protein
MSFLALSTPLDYGHPAFYDSVAMNTNIARVWEQKIKAAPDG